jgi:hypothetical protein
MAIPSQARRDTNREGVETRRAAPKLRISPGEGEGIVQTANRMGKLRTIRAAKAVVGKKIRRAHKACEGSTPSARTTFNSAYQSRASSRHSQEGIGCRAI